MAQELMSLKVATGSNPAKVATSIAKNMQEGRDVETISIGAGAANQALKAVTIARGLTASMGWDLIIRPGFRVQSHQSEPSAIPPIRTHLV